MAEYYVLEEQPIGDTRELAGLGPAPDVPGVNFMRGHRFGPSVVVPRPLRYELSPEFPGELPWFFKAGGPLMHERMVEALRRAGVDNIDVYDALLVDPEDGSEWTEFKAVNILGVVAASDPARTTFDPTNPARVINAQIEKLVLRPEAMHGFLIFRLAEQLSTILVHEGVKAQLEAARIGPLGFIAPDAWYGGV